MTTSLRLDMGIRENETVARMWERDALEGRAAQLVVDAMTAGFKITIHNEPVPPLAMRNDVPVIHVYESRK